MRATFKLFVLAAFAFFVLTSCAPKPVDVKYPEPKTDFGPLLRDTDLGLESMSEALLAKASVNHVTLNTSLDSARVFRLAETLNTLGAIRESAALTALGHKIGDSFYSAKGISTRGAFHDSVYVLAAAGETKASTLLTVADADQLLKSQFPILDRMLNSLKRRAKWPKKGDPPEASIAAAESFGEAFLRESQRSELDPQVKEAIQDAFDTQFFPMIRTLEREFRSITSEPRSVIILRRIQALAVKHKFILDDETSALLEKAERTMLMIENIEKRHDVLTVLVELWEMTNDESREKIFKPASKELYEYLLGKNAKELDCVKNPSCKRPFVWLPKKLIILPAIERAGIENLKEQISVAARNGLIGEINSQVTGIVENIPDIFAARIEKEITGIRRELYKIRTDYAGFIEQIAEEFASNHLRDGSGRLLEVNGLEARRVKLTLAPGQIVLAAETRQSPSSSVVSGAEVVGASMAYAASTWTTQDSPDLQRSVLSQINKMLSIGGFKTPNGKRFPSLALSLDTGAAERRLYIRDTLKTKSGYAVPDQFQASSSLITEAGNDEMNVSVKSQAELLRGLSAMVRYFRDWEKSSFDESLGKIQIGTLIKDLPSQSLKQRLFPKEMMLAVAIGNSASILQNLTKKLSPVFLIDLKNQTEWSDATVTTSETNEPQTMAGVVDIKSGKRTETVKTADAARFLLAISEFLDATEGIENTQAALLLEKSDDGSNALEQLLEAKHELRLLVVGLGNFISHAMAAKDGGIRSSFSQLKVTVQSGEARTLNDQVLSILALERASHVLKRDIYAWSALDALFYMNKTLWNPTVGFYVTEEGSNELPPVDDLAAALLAGERLKSRMSAKSRAQWELISQPWLKAIEAL